MTILEQAILEYLERSSAPRYQSIAEAICHAIDQGILQASERLPTHRALAEAIGVSVQTVSHAYAYAEQQGFVVGKVGSGTYVSLRKAQQEADFLKNAQGSKALIDLSIIYAIGSEQQEQAFAETLGEMMVQPEGRELINVSKPFAGLQRHREAAVKWVARLGIQVPAEQICITNGATHALLIAMTSLVHPGESVACAQWVDHGLISLARTLNFRLEGVTMDEEGMVPEALDTLCEQKQITAICVTPTLNNPTGHTLSVERRRAIAEIALRRNIPLVEDDVFAALNQPSLPPISSFAPELSYYITSFTKVVAAGLRIGYLVPPRDQVSQVIGRLRASSWMASPLSSGVAAQWIESGRAQVILNGQIKELQARYRLAVEELSLPAQRFSPFIWLPLPVPWRGGDFVAQAKQKGVLVTPAEPFVVGHQPAPQVVRISLTAATSRAELRRGLQVVRSLLKQEPPPGAMEYPV